LRQSFLKPSSYGRFKPRENSDKMWDLMVGAAQSPALQWTVIAGVLLAYVYKLFSSGDAPLMGDMYGDDLDL
jgi:hypothetical protein